MKPEFPKLPGIYGIQSLHNGKMYIGSAVNLRRRRTMHSTELKKHKHCNRIMQSHVNKYGFDDFRFFILEIVPDKHNLINREQFYLDKIHPEFNICPNAGSALGRIVTDEHREALSLGNKGRPLTKEHREKLSKAHMGQTPTKETIEKRSRAMLGHVVTQETRDKISKANKGKIISEEARIKISIALTGTKASPEARKKMSEFQSKRGAEMRANREREYNLSGGIICNRCGRRIEFGKVIKKSICSSCHSTEQSREWRKKKKEEQGPQVRKPCRKLNPEEMERKIDKIRGVNNKLAKLSESDVISIKLLLRDTDMSQYKIADKFNISRSVIAGIKQNRAWRHINI